MQKRLKKPIVMLLIAFMLVSSIVPNMLTGAFAEEDIVPEEEPQEEVLPEEDIKEDEAIPPEIQGDEEIEEPLQEPAKEEELLEEITEEVIKEPAQEKAPEEVPDAQAPEETLEIQEAPDEPGEIPEEEIPEESEELSEQEENRMEDLSLIPDSLNFVSKRLIVKGSNEVVEGHPVIASLDGVHLIQYETEEDAKLGWLYFSKEAESVEVDGVISIAEGESVGEPTEEMTEEENPFKEVEEASVDKIRYDVAVIDTGANNADKIVSVLGDDGRDNHGHGQEMINTIKELAPGAKVLSIKAINDNGVGDISSVYAAIKLAIESDVTVINLSISSLKTEDSFVVEEVIKEAVYKGITVIGAAGNRGMDVGFTIFGSIPEMIVVGVNNSSSNYGSAVDYIVNAPNTSSATAAVTGLYSNGSLGDYDKEITLSMFKEESMENLPFILVRYEDGTEQRLSAEEFLDATGLWDAIEEIPYASEDGSFSVAAGSFTKHIVSGIPSTTRNYYYDGRYLGSTTEPFHATVYQSIYNYNPNLAGGAGQKPSPFWIADKAEYFTVSDGAEPAYCLYFFASSYPRQSTASTDISNYSSFSTEDSERLALIYHYLQNKTGYSDGYGKGFAMIYSWTRVGVKLLQNTSIGNSFSNYATAYSEIALGNLSMSTINSIFAKAEAYADSNPDGLTGETIIYWDSTSAANHYQPMIRTRTWPGIKYIKLKKSSSEPSITKGNSNYSLIGTTYKVYDNANLTGDPIATLVVEDEDGNTNVATVSTAGTYYFKETVAGRGYKLKPYDASTDYIVVTSENTETNPAIINTREEPFAGKVSLNKVSSNPLVSNNNRYSLEGAVYEIFKDKNCTDYVRDGDGYYLAFRTDRNGKGWKAYWNTSSKSYEYWTNDSSCPDYIGLPPGDYWVKEYKAPDRFYLPKAGDANYTYKFSIQEGQDSNISITAEDVPKPEVRVTKRDITNTGFSLAGAVYFIRRADDGGIVKRIITNTDGTGYEVVYVGTNVSDYELTYNAEEKLYRSADGKYIARTIEDGRYLVGDTASVWMTLDEGSYRIVEAWEPTNGLFAKNSESTYFNVLTNEAEGTLIQILDKKGGSVTTTLTNKHLRYPQVSSLGDKSGVKVYANKISDCPEVTKNHPLYSLTGIKFNLYSDASCQTPVKDIDTGNNAVWTVKADGTSNEVRLLAGKYYYKEISQGTGYRPKVFNANKDYFIITDAQVQAQKTIKVEIENTPNMDPIYILLQKKDARTGLASPQGSGTLGSAEYTVKYYKNMNQSGTPAATWIFKTDADGFTYYTDDPDYKVSGPAVYRDTKNMPSIPIGSVTIQETKAPHGYKLDSTIYKVYFIEKNGVVRAYKDAAGTQLYGIINQTNECEDISILSTEQSIQSGVKFSKIDAPRDKNVPEGDATLKDAEITIYANEALRVGNKTYAKNDAILTIKTDANGNSTTANDALPVGKYYAKETKESRGYLLNTSWRVDFEITDTNPGDKKILDKTKSKLPETPIRGGVSIQKWGEAKSTNKASGDATLKDAVFEIINRSNEAVVVNGTTYAKGATVMTINTNDLGKAQTGAKVLPYGTYEIKEKTAPEGYLLNNTWTATFQIREDGSIVDITNDNMKVTASTAANAKSGWISRTAKQVIEVEKPQYIKITKKDSQLNPQGDAKVQGIKFAIVNASKDSVMYKGVEVGVGRVITVLTTDVNGACQTEKLPYGTYSIYELRKDATIAQKDTYAGSTKLGSSIYANDNGYLFKANKAENEVMHDNGKTYSFSFTDDIVRGDIKIEKWDKELDRKAAQGDADFAGIKFEITNKSIVPVYISGKEYAKDAVVATITANAAGDASTTGKLLPYGTYEIKEVATNGKYLLTDGEARTFRIRTEGEVVTKDTQNKDIVYKNIVRRGGVKFLKIDSETDTNAPQGRATLKDAEITIYNNSKTVVKVDSTEYAPGQAVMTLTTNEKGECQTDSSALPYGTYYAVETKKSEGYNLNDKWRVDFQIREEGKIVDTSSAQDKISQGDNKSGWFKVEGKVSDPGTNQAKLEQEIIRGDISWFKMDIDGSEMGNIPFLVSRLDENGKVVAGDQHVIVTDEHGRLNTSDRPKTGNKVNSLDQYLRGGVYEGPLDGTTGIWFGEQSARDDNKGSLIYANYLIEELQCEKNKDHDLLKQYMIAGENGKVSDEVLSRVFTEGKIFMLDNIFINLLIHPESDFEDVSSDTKTVTLSGETVVEEDFRWDHLKIGETYKLKTIIYYEDREGNVTKVTEKVQDITPKQVDETNTSYGIEVVKITLDSSSLKGGFLHAVDEIYKEVNGEDVLLTSHNRNMDDSRQMIGVPYCETVARDIDTSDHQGAVKKSGEIRDIIKYENFPEDKSFTIVGKLLDRDNPSEVISEVRQSIRISNRVTAPVERFGGIIVAPKTSEIEMPAFKFDATNYEGKTLIVFESFYDQDTDELYLEEVDLMNEDESVHFSKVGTTAIDNSSREHTGTVGESVKIIDKVLVENIVKDYEYKLKGEFVRKDTLEVVATAEKVFVGEETGGSMLVDIEFTVDSSVLEDVSCVAFEYLYHNDVEVAKHEEPEDPEQTINFPKVNTTAKDAVTKTHTGRAVEDTEIIDTVELKNLTVGESYKVVGTLMTEEGKAFTIDGENVTVSSDVFKATSRDMTLDLSFVFNGTKVKGETLVVFEKLFHVNAETKNEVEVSRHEDPKDEGQSIHYPDGGTTASDIETKDHVGTVSKEAKITDVVTYKNLVIGEEYTFKGKLHYASGEKKGTPVVINGKEIANEVTFIADSKNGEVNIEFSLDAEKLQGETVVVFEDFYSNDIKVFSHSDVTDEGQSVHYLKVGTVAQDKETSLHTGIVQKDNILIDQVAIENTVKDAEYVVKGKFVRTDTLEVIAEAEKTFTAKENGATEIVELEFTLDSSELDGASAVAFEYLYHNDVEVAKHEDPSDPEQTVNFPKVNTTAVDGNTKSHTGNSGETSTIIDTVELKNLTVGDTYMVVGTLMNTDGTEFMVDGKALTIESEPFKADAKNMTKELTFSFDSSELGGKSLVVFEKLLVLGVVSDGTNIDTETGTGVSGIHMDFVEVARHEDLTDEGQTVHYPSGKTNASDSKTNTQVGTVGKTEIIVDKVSYSNLVIGETYTVTGELHYREDFGDHKAGDTVKNEKGEVITSSETFVAESSDGFILLTYEVNSELLRGASIVVFEDFYNNGVKVYSHANLEDVDQRIDYPEVKTTLISEKTKDHVGDTDNTTILVDTVELTNLRVGETYTLRGTLMDKDTDKEIEGVKTEPVTFVAEERNMTLEITFTLSGKERESMTTVAFEELIHNGVRVSYHADLEDKDQTVWTPSVITEAKDRDTGINVGLPREETVIVDKITLKNLLVGQEYTVKGYLMDQETGEKYIDADGNEVIGEPITFVAEKSEEVKEMTFIFNGSNLKGKTLVVFEDLIHNEVLVAAHHDINSKPQSVDYPDGHTTAKDAKTETKSVLAEEQATVIDRFYYKNLRTDYTYLVTAELVDKETGEVISVKVIPLTPGEKDGFVDIEFTFNSNLLRGKTLVAFENVKYGDKKIIIHEDINDPEQTVYIPKIGTVAKDKMDGDDIIVAKSNQVIVDTLQYEGLEPNKAYEAVLTVFDKTEGKLLEGVEVHKVFTSNEDGIGEIDVEVTVDGNSLAGHLLVMYEEVYRVPGEGDTFARPESPVGEHKDPNATSQTIYIPKIGTILKSEGKKEVFGKVDFVDTVKYENLKTGVQYTLQGELVMKDTKEVIARAEITFTPKDANGEVEVIFKNVDTSSMIGKSIVAFETLTYKAIDEETKEEKVYDVAEHKDLNDPDQTVVVNKPPTTGDENNLGAFLILFISAGMLAIAINERRKLSQK